MGKWQWLISPPCAGLTHSTFSFKPESWEKKKERTPDLGCQTPSRLPGTPIHTSVPSLQVWGHKLAVRMDQGKTLCESFVQWYNHRPYLFPWRIFCTHIMVVIIVKISTDCRIQTKSILTLPVFNYPPIARHKSPRGKGKIGDFNNSVPCQGWYIVSFTYKLVSL